MKYKIKRQPTAAADFPRLALAIRKLAQAASGHIGSDCYIHAALAAAILEKLGVKAQVVAGWAGWRVGDGDSDVILHAPSPGLVVPQGGFPYHVWLFVGGHIFDATLWQLREKARQLDAQDGGKTVVTWCPDYLYADKRSVSSLKAVIQQHAGMYYYKRVPEVEKRVFGEAPTLDQADLAAAWMLYQNPEMLVFGPNDAEKGQQHGND